MINRAPFIVRLCARYRCTITYTTTRNMRVERFSRLLYTLCAPVDVYYRPSCHSGRNTKEILLALAMQTIFKPAFKRAAAARGGEM